MSEMTAGLPPFYLGFLPIIGSCSHKTTRYRT